jgi:hypothetical protein
MGVDRGVDMAAVIKGRQKLSHIAKHPCSVAGLVDIVIVRARIIVDGL